MKKMITVVLVGAGNRANVYASVSLEYPEKMKVVGIVDPDYRGEYIVALHNDSDIPQTVLPGERIAQMVFQIHGILEDGFTVVDEISETSRGDGGFGSTGEK